MSQVINKLYEHWLSVGLLIIQVVGVLTFQTLTLTEKEELSGSGLNGQMTLKNVSYTYTIWIGTTVDESYTISQVSPENSNFYEAMIQAAELDSR